MESKVCTKCRRHLPLNSDYYFVCKGIKSGFKSACKECLGFSFTKRGNNGVKLCHQCNTEYPATSDHFSLRKNAIGLDSTCKKCKREYDIQYRQNNRDLISERTKIRRIANFEHIRIQRAESYRRNKEKISSSQKAYYLKNRERRINYVKSYYEQNKEKVTKRIREYFKRHPEKEVIKHQKRRALKKSLPANLTTAQWENCKTHFDYKCAYCGRVKKLTQDHFVPLSKGGEYTINNIIPACISCNSRKNDIDFFRWYPHQGFYSKQRERKIIEYLNYKGNTQQLALI